MKRNLITAAIALALMTFTLGLAVKLSAGASTAKPITTKQAARQYLADAKPYNVANAKFDAAFAKWENEKNHTMAQTSVFVEPMVAAMSTFDRKALSQRWPAKVESAVRALVLDDATFQGDIESLPAVNVLTWSSWVSSFDKDATIDSTAANFVRSDLGLPLIET